MGERSAQIVGWGTYLPQRVLSNADLEGIVDTSDDWITTRTGIKERRIAAPGESTSTMGSCAAERAIQKAGIQASDLDLIISASATPDYLFPATAGLIQQAVGATCGGFDLEAGCSSFVYGLVVARQMIAAGGFQNILVVGAETLSRFMDYTDRATCVLFGDGAGAVVLQACPNEYGIQASELGADGAGCELIKLPAGGSATPATEETVRAGDHYVHMAGNQVFKFATLTLGACAERVATKAGWQLDDIDLFIPHQANIRIIEAAQKRLALPMDKIYVNVERYGNTSSASVPIAMVEAIEAGLIRKESNVVMVAFGVGLAWAGVAMRWGVDTGV
ncbi:MAG TPA: beta-ketoacyl-ACP synthase III [Chloroflexota bacterium]|jgi:3-oxoacyl-[acyl-carrier-protein] synthase-3|nr:beta-ketoacyl-ACP synthase III [Chloroflexota bacterium]